MSARATMLMLRKEAAGCNGRPYCEYNHKKNVSQNRADVYSK